MSEVPDIHIKMSYVATVSPCQILHGRLTRDFHALVPVHGDSWLEYTSFVRGGTNVPPANTYTKMSFQAAQAARTHKLCDRSTVRNVGMNQRAQLGPDAVAVMLDEFLQKLPADNSVRAVKLYGVCCGNPDWSSGFLQTLCNQQRSDAVQVKMAAVLADVKEHRVTINKVHAVETVVPFLQCLRLPDYRPLGPTPPGWEGQEPSKRKLWQELEKVRAQLSVNCEITDTGSLRLKDCPAKLAGIDSVKTARTQFQAASQSLGEPESTTASVQASEPAPMDRVSVNEDEALTHTAFEARYSVESKSAASPRNFFFVLAKLKPQQECTESESRTDTHLTLWISNETDSVIKMPANSEVCGLGRMVFKQLSGQGIDSVQGQRAVKWDFAGAAGVGVAANTFKLAFEKPGTTGYRAKTCSQCLRPGTSLDFSRYMS
ncbi:unnamed protein product [Symbiodinium natans]|uniref:Uncharacterized protein n=1 Tax=Symbiodinium natans TaxID=878477 RepID=A0A812PQP9_9DINO|nr:unnamed protein product [Symbiodinium natans]